MHWTGTNTAVSSCASTLKGHLVGLEKTWCGGVDCANGAGNYANGQSHVRVGDGYSDEFDVKADVHQDDTQPAALHHCA